MKTKVFNPFDYMDTQEEIHDFLVECFNDDDPKVFINALNHLMKKHGVANIAEEIGVNRESLYRSFNGKVSPRWDTVVKVMKVLNIDLTEAA
ncbi:addiction module antidote protein [Opacimonas viscosa]|uniref:Addiction module antidote protein n=1 Tax=Opacimonas viscosa TaxID=2961944 RepID=A0AA41X4C3_9ALTE|nr:addiction module antidote protein [Opacimonas viscosa]MCP3429572.1 putative addiction module antidote protein [Opacimonas viscosa]